MVQITAPRIAFVFLFTGAALVWTWEVALAVFGARPAIWTILAVGTALIFLSYLVLMRHERR